MPTCPVESILNRGVAAVLKAILSLAILYNPVSASFPNVTAGAEAVPSATYKAVVEAMPKTSNF